VSGSGVYTSGTEVTVSAIANGGYNFAGWYQNNIRIENAGSEYSFEATTDTALVARFAPSTSSTVAISVFASPVNGGSVSGSGVYTSGTEVTVSAVAATGYNFAGWYENSVKIENAGPEYSFEATADKALVAVFESMAPDTVTITVLASPANGGAVSGGDTYPSGQTVMVNAIAANGFIFEGWYENDTRIGSADAEYTFKASEHRMLVAKFEPRYGDTNGDGSVNEADLILMLRYFARPGTVVNTAAADMNGNSKIDNVDLVLLLKYFAQPEAAPGPAE
jgi:hypothetical protein